MEFRDSISDLDKSFDAFAFLRHFFLRKQSHRGLWFDLRDCYGINAGMLYELAKVSVCLV